MVVWFAPSGWNSQTILDGSYLGSAAGVGTTSTLTASGLSFGAANTHRWLVAAIAYAQSDGAFGTVTIGGVSATSIATASITAGAVVAVGLYKALVPSGTSGTVVVGTGGINTPAGTVGLYRFIANALGGTTDTDAVLGLNTSAAVASLPGDFVVGVANCRRNTTPATALGFTGLSEDYETGFGNNLSGAAHLAPIPATTTTNVSAAFTGGSGANVGSALVVASLKETWP